MFKLKEKIQELAGATSLNNRQIADKMGCSRRTVRRYAGPYAKRKDKILNLMQSGDTIVDLIAPKILLFDIETSPMEVYVWHLYKQAVLPHQVKKDWAVLSWSAKWLFDAEVMSSVVSPVEAYERTDSSIIGGIWSLLNDADIVIAHNGDQFDIRKLNSRFAMNGLAPPLPYRSIDTMKASKRVFSLSSYSLDYINDLFDLERKIETTFKLWKRCITGDLSALDEMVKYNRNDVLALEELYLMIRPWIKSHPNLGLFIDTEETVCTNCGNSELDWKGNYYTPAGKYNAFRCLTCGAIGRSRYSDLTSEERKKLCLSVAR